MPSRTPLFRAVLGWLERHLSRVTSGGHYIPEVDGIRFLAILAVMVYHAVGELHVIRQTYSESWMTGHGFLVDLIGMGYFGVEIFFTLSGFVVALPFARHALKGDVAPDLNRFYLRRLTRIEPPYLVALTAMYLASGNLRRFFPDFLASLIYSHRLFFGVSNPFAFVTWSLEVEVVFYILAPWLAPLYKIPNNYWRWLAQIALLGCYSYPATYFLPFAISQRFGMLQMFQYFLAGMILADFYACNLLSRSKKIAWDLSIAAATWGLFTILMSAKSSVWTFYWLIPFLIMLLFIGILKGRVANWFLRLRLVTLVGGMCYTLYLWHTFALWHMLFRMKDPIIHMSYFKGIAVSCLVFVPMLTIVLTVIYLLFEKPFMNGPGSRYLERRLASVAQRFRSVREPSKAAVW